MPAAVLVTYADYWSIRELKAMGFKEIPRSVKQRIVRCRDGVAIEKFVFAEEFVFEFLRGLFIEGLDGLYPEIGGTVRLDAKRLV